MTEWRDGAYVTTEGGNGFVAIGDTVSGGTAGDLLQVAAGPVLAQVFTTGIGTSWATYTPTISASGGAGTMTTSGVSGRWLQVGKILFFSAAFTITAVGTASGFPTFTLPNSLVPAVVATALGRETVNTGKVVMAAQSSGSIMQVQLYDFSSPLTNGNAFVINGVIEVS